MTANEVIRNWIRYRLLYKSPIEFSCVEIQSSVVEFKKKVYGILLKFIQESGER